MNPFTVKLINPAAARSDPGEMLYVAEAEEAYDNTLHYAFTNSSGSDITLSRDSYLQLDFRFLLGAQAVAEIGFTIASSSKVTATGDWSLRAKSPEPKVITLTYTGNESGPTVQWPSGDNLVVALMGIRLPEIFNGSRPIRSFASWTRDLPMGGRASVHRCVSSKLGKKDPDATVGLLAIRTSVP